MRWRRATPAVAACLALLSPAWSAAQAHKPELANRNDWQRPHWVMDVLDVHAGSVVADVGAGSGYFTLHLAGRVGTEGRVYAVDIREESLRGIRALASTLNLPQIETVLGTPSDPRLPDAACDVVLVVNSYHEMDHYDAMMKAFSRTLKPGGRLGIIEAEAPAGSARSYYFKMHFMPASVVRADAARHGFRFLRNEQGFVNPDNGEHWYFLVLERPERQER
jgi:ubiquinone/menaquinone biosynthesis C-methylase UbiE